MEIYHTVKSLVGGTVQIGGNFHGVQIFVESYPQILLNFSYMTK